MKVVGYVRIVPQEEGGECALAHQCQRLEEYCQRNNLELGTIHQEQVSGDLPFSERPKLKQAIDELTPGMALLVVRLDRLSGQVALLRQLIEALQARGAELKAVQGGVNPDQMKSSLEVTVFPAKQRPGGN